MNNSNPPSFHLDDNLEAIRLLVIIITALITLSGGSSSTLALDATRATTTVRRGESKVNVFLGVETDDE